MRGAVGEADLLEQRQRPLAQLRRADADRSKPRLDVLERGQGRDQVELLEDEAERVQPELRQLAVAERAEVAPLEEDAARARPVERAEQLQQGRLARAARALERDELARARSGGRRRRRPRSRRAPRWKNRLARPDVVEHGARSITRPASARRRAGAARRGRHRPRRRAGRRSTASRKPASSTPTAIGAVSATWSLTVRAVTSPRPKKPSPPPVLELAVSVGPKAPIAAATAMPRTTPRRPPRTPWASDSPTTWRTTSHCVQPSAFSVPSSRTRLPTDESVRSTASRKAATAASTASAVPSRFERLAASTSEPLIESATCFALATSRPRIERLDLLLHLADGGAVLGPDEQDVDGALLAREHLELRQRDVDVGRLAAERRPDEPDDGERRAVEVELRADLQVLPARVRAREQRLVGAGALARGEEPAARDERGVTTPMSGVVGSTPAIV